MKISSQNSILFLLAAFLFFTSCKSKKHLVAAGSSKKITAKTKIIAEDLLKHEIDFKTFQAKSKTTLSLDGKTFDVNLNLRIKKDEVIWASITAFAGIEVARVLITPDSVKVM